MKMESFENHPYWRPPYAVTVEILLEQIPFLFDRVKRFLKDPQNDDYVAGFVEFYRSYYITECNRGENTGTQTFEDTEVALTTALEHRDYQKTRNFSSAISHIFQDSLVVEQLQHQFTPSLAKKIDGLIGNGVFRNAGCYRTTDAKPSGYDYFYLSPTEIESEMDKLFRTVNEKMRDENAKWYNVASRFFIRFLYIHPFSNGNGRTARILLSALLVKHAIIPVSLFNVLDGNQLYLGCINEAHSFRNFKLFNSFLIESVFNSLYRFVSSLDICKSNNV
jgi:fido (protein-threonine AMPylation protein)